MKKNVILAAALALLSVGVLSVSAAEAEKVSAKKGCPDCVCVKEQCSKGKCDAKCKPCDAGKKMCSDKKAECAAKQRSCPDGKAKCCKSDAGKSCCK